VTEVKLNKQKGIHLVSSLLSICSLYDYSNIQACSLCFLKINKDVLPERINKKGTLNVDLLSREKGSLRKSVAETHEETETTDSDPINATLH
jgi:hypothetical protein